MEKEEKRRFWECEETATQTTPFFIATSGILSILIFFSGCAVLAGWALDISILKSVFPGLVTMKANTALCFVLSGASLWLIQAKRREDKRCQRIGLACGLLVCGIGAVTLLEYVFGLDLGIDQILFKELPNAILTSRPGRMAFNTAINFTIIGFALSLLTSKIKNPCFFVQILMIPVGIFSGLSGVGYIYHADPLILGLHFSTAMALHTMALFLVVFFAVLFCRPGCGFMVLVSSDAIGGRLIRRLLPVTVFVPILLGWIKIQGARSGWMSNEFGVSFVAITNLTFVTFYIAFLSFWLNRTEVERKLSEEKLKENEAQYRSLFDNMLNGFAYCRMIFEQGQPQDFIYLTVNDSFKNLTGLTDVVGKKASEAIPGLRESDPGLFEIYGRVARTGVPERMEIYVETLKMWFDIGVYSPSRDHFVVVFDVITERKQVEEALRQAEERYRELVEGTEDLITIVDNQGRFTFVNHSSEKIFGIKPEDCVGRSAFDFIHPEDRERTKIAFEGWVREKKKRVTYQNRQVNKNGPVFTVLWSINLHFDDSGEVVAVSNFARDITDLTKAWKEIQRLNQELEERVRQRTAELTAAIKGLDAFAYSVSHDLKAPLRAMAGFANILSEDYASKLDENGRRVIGVIDENARTMGQLIDDLLKLSRMGRTLLEVVDLDMTLLAQSVCRELEGELFHNRVIEIFVKPLLPAKADKTIVRQILTNIISNAIKFTGRKEKAVIEIGSYDKEGEHVYYVKDNGVGFDKTYANKLFEVFQRLHSQDDFEGTGVGLAIVCSGVMRHGGRVWAEAEVDQGATFYFTLPKGG